MIKLGMPQLYEFDTIEDNLKLCKELGLDFIELNLNFGYCRKALEENTIKGLLEQYGLKATLHFYDEADFGSYPEVCDAYLTLLDRYCQLSEGFIESMNIHICRGPVVTISGEKNYIYEKEFDTYIVNFVKNLHKAEAICNKYGLRMVLENTDDIPQFFVRVYDALYKDGFKFCYDIGHDHLGNGVVLHALKNNPLEFQEFHFHDGKDRKKCHLALGTGEIDLAYYKKLAEENDAWVNVEVKDSTDLRISIPYFKNMK